MRIVPPAEARARSKAAEMVAAAEASVRELHAAARAEGLAAGHAEAVAVVVAARTEAARERVAVSETVAQLACIVAAEVLGREAAGGLAVVRDVTVGVLAKVQRARVVLLRVCPEEVDGVRAGVTEWLKGTIEPDVLAVEADPSVGRGGVVVETNVGRIDGRLDVQLAAIALALGGTDGDVNG